MKKNFLLFLGFCCFIAIEAQVSKTINLTTAGTLTSSLNATEKTTVTNLTVTGTIDARDVKCMRDEMTVLAAIDLTTASINSYSGTEGTYSTSTKYPANEMPVCSFLNISTLKNKPSLKSISFPNTMTSIGANAFFNCSSITSITFPNSLLSIGSYAFGICSALTEFVVDPSNTNFAVVAGVLFDKNQNTIVQYPTGKSGIYTVPSSVTKIGNCAFYTCNKLTGINLPSGLTTIGNNGFESCSGLTSIAIPNTVNTFGNYAFYSCTRLTSFKIPNELTSLGFYAFSYCNLLTAFTVEVSNPSYSVINGVLFNKDQSTLILYPVGKQGAYTIPSATTTIATSAFYRSTQLTSVNIPGTVTSIGSYAFTYCSNLTEFITDTNNSNYSVVDGVLFDKNRTTLILYPAGKIGDYSIPNSVQTIGNYAFSSSAKMTSINIPNSVSTIGNYAFYYCNTLDNLNIPSTVTAIGSSAFYYCTGLKSIYANSVLPINLSLSTNVFYNINKTLCNIYVPKGSLASYQAANQWKDFNNILEKANTYVPVENIVDIRIFPNPVTEYFVVEGLESITTLSLLNLEGKVVFAKLVQNGDRISVGELPKGIYIARINTANGALDRKVVKQ